MPHEDHITALCFCNAEKSENPTLVTASKDGHFKVWILTDDSDIYSKLIKCHMSKECTISRYIYLFCELYPFWEDIFYFV